MGNNAGKANDLRKTKDLKTTADCSADLAGKWYNELGSEMTVNVTSEGIMQGEYKTAVETEKGATKDLKGPLIGRMSPDGKYRTFGFNVLWNEGTSSSSFAGEYKESDSGEPVLFTTWLLTSETDTLLDHWMNTRIGQNCFTRFRQVPSPGGMPLTEEERKRKNPCQPKSWDYQNKHRN